MKIPFDKEELKDVGMWKPVPKPYGVPAYPMRRFNTPITPKENFLMVCRKETPVWMPNATVDKIPPYSIICSLF